MELAATSARVLIVGGDDAAQTRLTEIVVRAGYATEEVSTAKAACELIAESAFDVVLMDTNLSDRSGLEALTEMSRKHPKLPVIFLASQASLDGAIEAIRNHAFDYLIQPVPSSDLLHALKRSTRLRRIERLNQNPCDLVESEINNFGIVASSKSMMDIVSLIHRLRGNSSPILISGESGTGKDLVARAIHLEGDRVTGPFIALNCTALPESLLESELFGHEKGAFTGADRAKRGLFSEADGGTLFLDEIGEMSPALQCKLLRVLQDGRVRPLGATEDFQCDVRIISATNRNLGHAIRDGSFRADLYYRLGVIPIMLQPLRDRPEDIIPLAELYCRRFNADRALSASALTTLSKYSWPGNVRELMNVIERSLALSDSEILSPEDLKIDQFGETSEPLPSASAESGDKPFSAYDFCESAADRTLSLKNVANAYIDEILRRTAGNKAAAARILGMNRTSLYRRRPSN
jgi:DNA-binding NtrC family response regulator